MPQTKKLCLALGLVLLQSAVMAQEDPKKPPAKAPNVELDLVNGFIKDNAQVPFDVIVTFISDAPDSIISAAGVKVPLNDLYMFYGKGRCASDFQRQPVPTCYSRSEWHRPTSMFGSEKTIRFPVIDPRNDFKPNRDYCLLIQAEPNGTGSSLGRQKITFQTTSSFADYVKLDFGVGYAPKPQAWFGMLSAHGYLTAVNDDADLGNDFRLGRQLLLRTSLFIGLAPFVNSSNTDNEEIKAVSGVGRVVYGIGFRAPLYYPINCKRYRTFGRRFLQPMRVNVGMLRYTQKDANPLIALDRTKRALFVSVTYNFNIVSLLGPVAGLFK